MLTHSVVKYLLEKENSGFTDTDIHIFESKMQYHLKNFVMMREREARTRSKLWTVVVNYHIGCPKDFFNTDKVIIKTYYHLPETSKTQF
jgi:hypothetical protein